MATKTAVLKIDLQLGGADKFQATVTNFEELEKTIKDLRASVRQLDFSNPNFAQANAQLVALEKTFRDLKRGAVSASDALANATGPRAAVGYYRQLQAQLVTLKNQFKDLSEAEVKGAVGQKLAVQTKKISDELKKLDAQLGDHQRNVGNYGSAFSALSGTFSKIAGPVAGVFAALNGGSQIIETTRAFEKLQAVLIQSFAGNKASAFEQFNQLKDLASELPVSLQELTSSFAKLKNRGFDPSRESLVAFTDIAVSNGKSLDQFTEAALDAATNQFERLREFGIVAARNGENLTLTYAGVSKTIKNTSANVTNYLLEISKLPTISGAAAAQTATLDGTISNLGDNIDRLFASLGSGGGILQSVVKGFSDLVGNAVALLETPLSKELENQQTQFNGLLSILKDTNASESERVAALAELKRSYPDYLRFVEKDGQLQLDLSETLRAGNDLFSKRIFLQSQNEELTKFQSKLDEVDAAILRIQKTGNESLSVAQLALAGNNNLERGTDRLLDAFRSEADQDRALLADLRDVRAQTLLERAKFLQSQDELAQKEYGQSSKQIQNLENINKKIQALSGEKAAKLKTDFTSFLDEVRNGVPITGDLSNELSGLIARYEELAASQKKSSQTAPFSETAAKKAQAEASRLAKQAADNANAIEEARLNALDESYEKEIALAEFKYKKQLQAEGLNLAQKNALLDAFLSEANDIAQKWNEIDAKAEAERLKKRADALKKQVDEEAAIRARTTDFQQEQAANARDFGDQELGIIGNTEIEIADEKFRKSIAILEKQGLEKEKIEKLQRQRDFESQQLRLQNEITFQEKLLASIGQGNEAEAEKIRQQIAFLKAQKETGIAENDLLNSTDAKERRRRLKDFALETASELSTELGNLQTQALDNQLSNTLSALDAEYKAKIEAAQGNAALEAQLQDELAAKKIEAEKKVAREKKRIALAQASIEYAISLIKIFGDPNIVTKGLSIAAASINYALQLATISAQQFAHGGIVGETPRGGGLIQNAPNTRPTRHGDNVLIHAKRGEMVLNATQQRRAMNLYGGDIFRRMGVPNAPHFATASRFAGNVNVNASASFKAKEMRDFAETVAARTGASVAGAVFGATYSANLKVAKLDKLRRQTSG